MPDDDRTFGNTANRRLRKDQTIHIPDDILDKSGLEVGEQVHIFVEEESGSVGLLPWNEVVEQAIGEESD